jgi:hypothetical protein
LDVAAHPFGTAIIAWLLWSNESRNVVFEFAVVRFGQSSLGCDLDWIGRDVPVLQEAMTGTAADDVLDVNCSDVPHEFDLLVGAGMKWAISISLRHVALESDGAGRYSIFRQG